ncbi:MAG: DUF4012 domain-containing protein [Anaerolineae bacterium]|nr:DUF4012 domain-containing protein [Anaerolineae bacterium]
MKIIKSGRADNIIARQRFALKRSALLSHVLIYLGLVALGLVLILGVTKSYRIYAAYQKISTEIDSLQAITATDISSISEQDMAQQTATLSRMAEQFAILQREIEPLHPILDSLEWVPVYGGDLQAAPTLVATGYNVSQALVILVEPLSDAVVKIQAPNWLSETAVQLNNARPEIELALALLRQSQADLETIPVEKLSPALADKVKHLQQLLPPITSGTAFALQLPALLGMESPQTYLILAPNADELRPIGGFVTVAGHITFDQGRIVDFSIHNSPEIDKITDDYPYPPEPLYNYMEAGYWLIRDVTWSPDFPSMAETAIDLYEMGQGIRPDGVISLDQYGLAQLLRAFQPLSVDGEQVTSQNVIKLMRWHWSPAAWNGYEGAWAPQRKTFLIELGQTLRQTIEQQPSTITLPVLFRSVQQALAEKHLLIYLHDPEQQSMLADENRSGVIHPGDGDYLMMVDANLGFNKASAVVQRGLTYDIVLATDGSAKAHTRLTYQHQGQNRSEPCVLLGSHGTLYEDNMHFCYWNYMRLVTPAAAKLISGPSMVVEGQYLLRGETTTGKIDVESISDKQSWGQLFLLAPGDTASLDFVYDLPAGTARLRNEGLWEYTLYLQKQPGTLQTKTAITITLPDGAAFHHSQPALETNGQTQTFMTELKTDQEIRLYYTVSEKE